MDSRKAEATLNTLQGSLAKADKSARRAAEGMNLFEKAAGRVASVEGTFNAIDKGARRAGEGMKTFEAAVARVRSVQGAFKDVAEGLRGAVDGMKRYQDAVKQAGSAQSSLKGVDQSVSKAGEAFKVFKASLPGRAMDLAVDGFKAMISIGSSFHAEMSNVAAMTGASRAELDLLTNAARSYGEAGTFSALQAAEAQRELAATGMSVKDILASQGAVMELATATNGNFATAAGLTSTALSQFGVGATEAGRVANLFAEAVRTSGADIEVLGKSMEKVGPNASKIGLSLEETTAALTLFGEAGFGGEPAADALNAALTGLTEPGEKGREVIERLGLQMEDSAGRFVGMEKMMHQLGAANLSYADTVALFGSKSAPAISAFVDQGATAFNQLKESLTGTDAATAMAGEKLNNLGGDWQRFNNTMESVAVTAFGAVREPMRGLVQEATGFVSDFSQTLSSGLPYDMLKAEAELWFSYSADGFEQLKEGFASIGISGDSLGRSMELVGAYFSNLWEVVRDGVVDFPANFSTLVTIVVAEADKLWINLSTGWDELSIETEKVWENISYFVQSGWLAMREAVAKGIDFVLGLLAQSMDKLSEMAGALPDWMVGDLPEQLKAGAEAMRGFATNADAVAEESRKLTAEHNTQIASLDELKRASEESATARISSANEAVTAALAERDAQLKLRDATTQVRQAERQRQEQAARAGLTDGEGNHDAPALNAGTRAAAQATQAEEQLGSAVGETTRQFENRSHAVDGANDSINRYRENVDGTTAAEDDATASTLAGAAAIEEKRQAMERAGETADEVGRSVDPVDEALGDAMDSVGEAFRKYFESGFKSFDKFKEDLKDSFEGLVGDLLKRATPEPILNLFTGGLDAFKKFAGELKTSFMKLLGDLAYKAFLNPIIVSIKAAITGQGGKNGLVPSGEGGVMDVFSTAHDIWSGEIWDTGYGYAAGYGLNYAAALSTGAGTTQAAMLAAQTGEFGLFGAEMTAASGAYATGGSLAASAFSAMPYVAAALFAMDALGVFDSDPDNASWVIAGHSDPRYSDTGSFTSGLPYTTWTEEADPAQAQSHLEALGAIDTALYSAYGSDMSGGFNGQSQVFGLIQDRFTTGLDRGNQESFIRAWIDSADNIDQRIKNMVENFEGEADELLVYATSIPAAFESVSAAFEALGWSFDPLAENAYSASMAMVEAAGGLEKFGESWSGYFQRFYTEEEQTDFAQGQVFSTFGEQINDVLSEAGLDQVDLASLLPSMTPEEYRAAVTYLQENSGIATETLNELIPLLWNLGSAAYDTGIFLADAADALSMEQDPAWGAYLQRFYSEDEQQAIAQRGVFDDFGEQLSELFGTDIDVESIIGGMSVSDYRALVDTLRYSSDFTEEQLRDLIPILMQLGVQASETGILVSDATKESQRMTVYGVTVAAFTEAALGAVPAFEALKERFIGVSGSIAEVLDTLSTEEPDAAQLAREAYAAVAANDWDTLNLRLDAIEEYRDHLVETIREEQRLAEVRQQGAESLRGFLAGLEQSQVSPLSSTDRLRAARDEYERLLGAAREDPARVSDLTGAAGSYLEAAQAQFASSADYMEIWNRVQSDLGNANGGGLLAQWEGQPDVTTVAATEIANLETLQRYTQILEDRFDDYVLNTLSGAYGSLATLPEELATAIAPYYPGRDIGFVQESVAEEPVDDGIDPLNTDYVPQPGAIAVDTSPTRPTNEEILSQWGDLTARIDDPHMVGWKMREWAVEHGLTASDMTSAFNLSTKEVYDWLEQNNIPRFATGGIAAPWTPAVVGDGPDWEAVIPLKNGAVPVDLNVDGVVEAVERSGRASVSVLVELGKKVDEMAGELADLRRGMALAEAAT